MGEMRTCFQLFSTYLFKQKINKISFICELAYI